MHTAFVKKISFPLLARRAGLKNLYGHLKSLEDSQYWPREKLMALQLERMKALLCHAYAHVPYYRARMDEAGFVPEKFTNFGDLAKLPLLSKEDIRENQADLLANNIAMANCHASETGGTTGVKMRFCRDNACLAAKEAARYRFERWTGWNFGEPMGLVWTAQQDYVGHWTRKARIKNSLFERQAVLPAAILDSETIVNYISLLRRKKPTMVRAFTSPLYEVATHILKAGLTGFSLKGIVTTGEPLYPHQRETIEKAFGCEIFDSYRCREVGPIAQECETHEGMHINAEALFVEIVPAADMPHENGLGEVVVTDLLNHGMPFIRYRMGDLARLAEHDCPCGRGLPLLKDIAGRTADLLFTPKGKAITAGSLVLYLVDEAPGLLGQAQIIQDDVDHLLIRLTRQPLPSQQIMDYQRDKVRELFGPDMRVDFDLVESIPRASSGKYRFAICAIPRPREI